MVDSPIRAPMEVIDPRVRAYVDSNTAPDPQDPTSKSAKTWSVVAGVYANTAATARDASIVNAQTYVDIATGLAAVANNATFDVQGSGNTASFRYRKTGANTSTLIATFPSKAYIDQVGTGILPTSQTVNTWTEVLTDDTGERLLGYRDSSGYWNDPNEPPDPTWSIYDHGDYSPFTRLEVDANEDRALAGWMSDGTKIDFETEGYLFNHEYGDVDPAVLSMSQAYPFQIEDSVVIGSQTLRRVSNVIGSSWVRRAWESLDTLVCGWAGAKEVDGEGPIKVTMWSGSSPNGVTYTIGTQQLVDDHNPPAPDFLPGKPILPIVITQSDHASQSLGMYWWLSKKKSPMNAGPQTKFINKLTTTYSQKYAVHNNPNVRWNWYRGPTASRWTLSIFDSASASVIWDGEVYTGGAAQAYCTVQPRADGQGYFHLWQNNPGAENVRDLFGTYTNYNGTVWDLEGNLLVADFFAEDASRIAPFAEPPGVAAVTYNTRDLLYADLAHDAGVYGKVTKDATGNNYTGYYIKVGASGEGSWTRVGNLTATRVYDVPDNHIVRHQDVWQIASSPNGGKWAAAVKQWPGTTADVVDPATSKVLYMVIDLTVAGTCTTTVEEVCGAGTTIHPGAARSYLGLATVCGPDLVAACRWEPNDPVVGNRGKIDIYKKIAGVWISQWSHRSAEKIFRPVISIKCSGNENAVTYSRGKYLVFCMGQPGSVNQGYTDFFNFKCDGYVLDISQWQ